MDSVLRGVACSRPSYILVPVVFVYRAERPNIIIIIIIIVKLDVVDVMDLRHRNRWKVKRQLRLLTLIGAS